MTSSGLFPAADCLVRLQMGERKLLGLLRAGSVFDLSPVTLDELMTMRAADVRKALSNVDSTRTVTLAEAQLLSPAEGQEVWCSGVTFRRSREARVEESIDKDIYSRVYRADRPEIFFKAAGWRVVPPGGELAFRSDSAWNIPEPELAVLSNRYGEVIAYSCGNDMSSRSIEGENSLYLPQAKIYDASCAIGPAAALAWGETDVGRARIHMTIERSGTTLFFGETYLSEMVRRPSELSGVLHSALTLPVGAWLLTGTGIVPEVGYTAEAGDEVTISIEGVGVLINKLRSLTVSSASAPPRDTD